MALCELIVIAVLTMHTTDRYLKLNDPTFTKVARHLGDTLTTLSISHLYDDALINVRSNEVVPLSAHDCKFSTPRLLAFLTHLRHLVRVELRVPKGGARA